MENIHPTTTTTRRTISEANRIQHNQNVFPVAVVENASAERCRLAGLYELHINSLSLTLHNITSKRVLYTWPYKHIRRYGRSTNNFQFEAGRKCQSGEGLFSVITEEGCGELLFTQITKRFDDLRRKKSSSECSSSGSSTESDSEVPQYEEAPALPPRNYKTDTLQSLFAKRAAKGKKTPKLKMSCATKDTTISRSQSAQESHYDEVELCNEEAASKSASAAISPSVINSLIRKHKDTLMGSPKKQKQKALAGNNNNNDMKSINEEAVYHVLHDNRNKLPTENFYSEIQ